MKITTGFIILSLTLVGSFIHGVWGSAIKSKNQASISSGNANLQQMAGTTGAGITSPGDDLLAMESSTDEASVQANIAAAAVHYHYNNLPKDEATKPQTYYYDHVPTQTQHVQSQQQYPHPQAELHEGNKYPLHSDVVAAFGQQKNKHKSKFQLLDDQEYLELTLPFSHNGVVNMIIEVFGAAIIPILLLPLIGLGLLYLIWSTTQKQRQHLEAQQALAEEYSFDDGATYGKGKNSYVAGYNYGASGGHRKINELTRQIVPQLNKYDKKKKY